ncbi:MAG: SpoIID/LytB domain-containing protein [Ruminococcaceae bacterium]|nr:SpoIID/LytB domain-containing protein [Oscillospiraceae bacterium]
MNASIIWYRARPSDELQQHLADMLSSVRAEVIEENVTIKAEQIASLMASAMRSADITVTVGGMDLRRDDENIVLLAAKCIRAPLELGRSSRSRYIYDPMRGAPLPSFETAVLFPSAVGGAEGAVLSTGSQTIIMLPRLEGGNTDILDMIEEYLPMLIGLPEEPEPEPEEKPGNPENRVPGWDRESDVPHKHYYDENGNRLPEYIERVLARKEHIKVDRDREITSSEIYTIFRDDESEVLAEDNLYTVYDDGEDESPQEENTSTVSPWEQMFDAARKGAGRSAAVQRYEELMNSPEPEQPRKKPRRGRKNREIDALWGTEPLVREKDKPEARPSRRVVSSEKPEKKPAEKTPRRAVREPQPPASAKRKAATPNVNIELKKRYKPAVSARRGTVLPEPEVPKDKPMRQATAPAFRAAAILLIVSIIISACYVAFSGYQPGLLEEEKSFYQSELASLFDPENTDAGDLPTGALARFSALYAENNDVCGYISIPGTDIAQPILRSYASSPDFYSHYSFYGSPDDRGALYFDSGNVFEWGTSNYNLVVYGNAPSDGSMFAGLRKYTDAQYLAEHPIINLDTLYEKGQWIIFAVCIVSGDKVDEFNYSNTDFVGAYSHQIHLYNLYIRSMFYTNTEVLPDEKILTLITDSDAFTGAKLIVCGRKVRADEDLSKAGASVISNPNVMMPDLWYTLNGTEMPAIPELELPTEGPTTAYTTLYPPTTTEAPTTTTTAPAQTQPGETPAETTTTIPTTTVPTTLEASTAKNMRITSGGKIIEGTAEDVLAMIVEAEMGSGYEHEALKAQAVASYTYYLYSGGSAKAPTFPTKTPSEESLKAVREVLGQYMSHGGMVPYTPYYATSAGMTASNSDMNVAELSWLVSVDCSVDKNVAGYRTEKRMTSLSVANRVKETKDIDLTVIEDKSTWFEVLERDANDLYVTSVRVGDEVYKGNTLHLSVLGYSYLRSPCFWIEYDEATDDFIFTSLGYGTGVGMSQTGANEYAKQGQNYVWILQHFYPGVTLKAN